MKNNLIIKKQDYNESEEDYYELIKLMIQEISNPTLFGHLGLEEKFQNLQNVFRLYCRDDTLNFNYYLDIIENIATLKLAWITFFNKKTSHMNILVKPSYYLTPELLTMTNLSDFLFDGQKQKKEIFAQVQKLENADLEFQKFLVKSMVSFYQSSSSTLHITKQKRFLCKLDSLELQIDHLLTLYSYKKINRQEEWERLFAKYNLYSLYMVDTDGELVECFDLLFEKNQILQSEIQKRLNILLKPLIQEMKNYIYSKLNMTFYSSEIMLQISNIGVVLERLEWLYTQLNSNADMLLCLPFLQSQKPLPDYIITTNSYYLTALKNNNKLTFKNIPWVEGSILKLSMLYSMCENSHFCLTRSYAASCATQDLVYNFENTKFKFNEEILKNLPFAFIQTYIDIVTDQIFILVEQGLKPINK